MNKSIKNNLLLLAGLIIIAAVAGSSFYFGYQKGTEKPQTIVIEGISGLPIFCLIDNSRLSIQLGKDIRPEFRLNPSISFNSSAVIPCA